MKKKSLLAFCVVIVLAIITALIVIYYVIPERKYKNACALLDSGNYTGAIEAFSAIGGYKDSADQAILAQNELDYQSAIGYLNAGNYEEAIKVFTALSDYKDSQDQLKIAEEANSLLMNDVEQYIYDLALPYAHNGSKVVLDSASVFCLKSGDENLPVEKSEAGKYIFLNGSLLWENGAKDDLFYMYETNKDGELFDTDILSLGKSGSSLQNTYDQYRASTIELVLLYYKYLGQQGRKITFEEYNNGEMGYIWIDDESIDRINKNLAN